MAGEGKTSDEGQAASSRRGIIHLRLSSIMAVLALAIGAVALAYVAGVMSGRNTARESTLQEEKAISDTATPLPNMEKDNNILAAEDLEFARVLRGKAPRPAAKPAPAQPAALQEAAPQVTPPVAEASVENNRSEVARENQATISDYIFQIAAFKEEAGADNLRQKLEGYGFRTRMERNGKLYVVLIALRGNEERAREVEIIAHELKLGDPVLRDRKAVNN